MDLVEEPAAETDQGPVPASARWSLTITGGTVSIPDPPPRNEALVRKDLKDQINALLIRIRDTQVDPWIEQAIAELKAAGRL